jgi:hypothetical protein
MGAAAAEFVQREFSQARYMERMLALYAELGVDDRRDQPCLLRIAQ